MPDANYAVSFSVKGNSDLDQFIYTAGPQGSDTKTAAGFRFRTKFAQNGVVFGVLNFGEASFTVFR